MPKSDDITLTQADPILKAIRQTRDDIKSEMREYFASKADLADWKIVLFQEMDIKVRECFNDHLKKDHKKLSLAPNPPGVIGRLTAKQIGVIVTAAVGLAGAITAYLQ